MVNPIPKKRKRLVGAALAWMAAIFSAMFVMSAAQAQPQFNQGFSRAGQPAPPNPAENAAYSAAISQSDPQAKISAIQQFLNQYPNSPLRQPAIAQMMMAKQNLRAAGRAPLEPASRANPPSTTGISPTAPATASNVSPQPASTPRESLLQQPAKPADVAVTPGNLSIKADNSSLSQILQDISKSTGMKVDGLGQDERIFGAYGPGDPREVLLSLLQGSGYNVLMIGDNKGAPRQLTLSQRAASSAIASTSPARNNHEQDDDEVEQEQPQPQPEPPQPANQPPPGNPDGVQPRNPAEIQQELLRLRQQQQQQQQPPQQQPQ